MMANAPESKPAAAYAAERNSRRVAVDMPVRLWLDVGWRMAQCENLSLGGLAVDAFVRLERGRRLVVSLEVAQGRWCDAVVEVVREGIFPQSTLGLRFVRLGPETLAALAQYVLSAN